MSDIQNEEVSSQIMLNRNATRMSFNDGDRDKVAFTTVHIEKQYDEANQIYTDNLQITLSYSEIIVDSPLGQEGNSGIVVFTLKGNDIYYSPSIGLKPDNEKAVFIARLSSNKVLKEDRSKGFVLEDFAAKNFFILTAILVRREINFESKIQDYNPTMKVETEVIRQLFES